MLFTAGVTPGIVLVTAPPNEAGLTITVDVTGVPAQPFVVGVND